MFSKGKKTVSLAYKNKLLAEIEYYEKRISETLQCNSSKSLTCYDDIESSDEDDGNPYTLNIHPSISDLKKQEASLESRVGMTLELAMLTIMHSDNANIMTEPPVVRRPVNEDGTWLEVTANCRIDLVSFVITFYAHKPYRKFAPTRYRNVEVKLSKKAHEKELAQSILAKLNRPNLALQVLQSYAAAFRSRRTTLLDLAQKYADKLRMEEMAEGGYRVKFLDLLTVDWSLENMWSPVVPFCHRMKFEVEYMPKEYIHTIGKLYKQFKDPSLETSERTHVLCQIFDTCLLAQEPARDLQESVESDPDTAGRLHERRTTIDQEPEVPSSYQSPKKSKGKENKAQNRKTAMEPPKTVPKKVKKSRPHSEVGGETNAKKSKLNNTDVTSDSRIAKKANDKNVTSDSSVDVAKRNKEEMAESRKGVKRGIENGTQSNAKKIRSENDTESNSKNIGDEAKAGNTEEDDTQNAKNVASKNDGKVTSAKNKKDDTNKKGDLKSASASSLRNKVANDEVITENGTKNIANSKDKAKSSIDNVKVTKKCDKNNANSKDAEENAGLKKTSNRKDDPQNAKNVASKNDGKVTSAKIQKDNTNKKGDLKSTSANSLRKKVADDEVITENTTKKIANAKSSIDNVKVAKKCDKNNANSKDAEENEGLKKTSNKKDKTETNNAANSVKNKADINKIKEAKSLTNLKNKMESKEGNLKKKPDDVNEKVAKNQNVLTENVEKNVNKVVTRKSNIIDKTTVEQNKIPDSNVPKNDTKKGNDPKNIANSKNANVKGTVSKNVKQASEKDPKKITNAVKSNVNAVKKIVSKQATKPKASNDPASKNVGDNILSNNNTEGPEQNFDKARNIKNNDGTFTKTTDKTFTKTNEVNTETIQNAVHSNSVGTKTVKDPEEKQNIAQNKMKAFFAKKQPPKSVSDKFNNDKNKKMAVDHLKVKENINPASKNTKSNPKERKDVTKPSSNNQNNIKTAVTSTKPNTVKGGFQKFTENQAKMAAKLQSKIPMMKSKIKISTLTNKVEKNATTKSAEKKTKIPQNNLPVFKKSNPTRISPRKLPSFKPPKGVSRK